MASGARGHRCGTAEDPLSGGEAADVAVLRAGSFALAVFLGSEGAGTVSGVLPSIDDGYVSNDPLTGVDETVMSEVARFAVMMRRSAELKQRIAVELADAVVAVVDACEASLRRGGKLMFCGNGGSAADSQHLATELLIRLRGSVERPSWPALALTLDQAALTAAGNDYGFEFVFERSLRGLGTTGGRAVRHQYFRPFLQCCARAASGSGDGDRDRGPPGRRSRACTWTVRPRAAGAKFGDGAHTGMPHGVGSHRARIARGPPFEDPTLTVPLTGAGLVGYHVVGALLARGERVLGTTI